ncbi:ABC transporter ATP-binding protein [Silvimonas amylolytica]|uniref:ABC transporter ATP-binding protein n=1 Tax=Silvimonas amylolytica TaxID=449663 RepID=A0ABQ2PIY6_9NEIS|nr:ATP-binding cassette domain-containing protein [Silvimonas amylolytica]GGP25315.1 ABC transporter ATP-binding protein [Silvimonas amylolytica]
MASIILRAVSKSYGDNKPTLRDVDLHIGDNEFCVFLGPSGCGKSTLLRIIAGLDDPTTGDILIDGARVNELPPAQRSVAMVFQSYALFPHMTVAQNIGFGLKLAKTPPAEVERKVQEAAAALQLEHLLARKPRELSGGQRQRVAIGRAIVRRPGVFLFDEPLSNLDATLRGKTRLEIARLHASFDKSSTVYVTHDQIEAMTLADKIVLLHAGKAVDEHGSIAQVGSPLDLYHRPKNRFVAGFIGTPQMNFIEGTVSDIAFDGVTVKLNSSNDFIKSSTGGSSLAVGQPVTLGIRPEHLVVREAGSTLAAGESAMSRTVQMVEHLGEQTYLHLQDPAGGALMAKVHGDSTSRPNDIIQVVAPATCCHLFTADGLAVPFL